MFKTSRNGHTTKRNSHHVTYYHHNSERVNWNSSELFPIINSHHKLQNVVAVEDIALVINVNSVTPTDIIVDKRTHLQNMQSRKTTQTADQITTSQKPSEQLDYLRSNKINEIFAINCFKKQLMNVQTRATPYRWSSTMRHRVKLLVGKCCSHLSLIVHSSKPNVSSQTTRVI